MVSETEKDTSRTVVKTYLPAYQREEWDDQAEELGMSRSEFVKAMVQAGKAGFEGEDPPATAKSDVLQPDPPAPRSPDTRGSLEDTVLETLSTDDHLSWDELLAAVTDDVETRLEETLQELQAENRIRYSGRHGGYTLDS